MEHRSRWIRSSFLAILFSVAVSAHGEQKTSQVTLADEIRQPEVAQQIDELSRSVETYNKVELLHPSSASFDARLRLIQEAKNFLFVTVPFWYADKSGLSIMDFLLAKARGTPNFDYRVLQDWLSPWASIGGFKIAHELGDQIVLWNHPDWQRNFSYNLFTGHVHDKFFIADGKQMIVGSTNINDEHLQGGETKKGWHDTDILVEGPAAEIGTKIFIKLWRLARYLKSDAAFPPWKKQEVAALQSYFYDDQEDHDFYTVNPNGPPYRELNRVHIDLKSYLKNPFYFPGVRSTPEYTTPMRLIYDNRLIDRDVIHQKHYSNIRRTLEFLLAHAKKSAWFYFPYATFDKEWVRTLKEAAQRIDVVMITNSGQTWDMSPNGYRGALSHYSDLLSGGVKIYEWQGHSKLLELQRAGCVIAEGAWPGQTLHSKIAFFDDQVVMLGSDNMNDQSFNRNNEVMALINDASMAKKIHSIFMHDLDPIGANAQPVTCGDEKITPHIVESVTPRNLGSFEDQYNVHEPIWHYPPGN